MMVRRLPVADRFAMRPTTILTALLLPIFGLLSTGCDSSFGQPCTLPKTEQFRRACSPVPVEEEETDENDIETESQASCAVKNFAGCATRVCLVYRGSDSYCSEPCESDDDCPGSAVCRPLLGDTDLDQTPCVSEDGFPTECYCVRSGDVQ